MWLAKTIPAKLKQFRTKSFVWRATFIACTKRVLLNLYLYFEIIIRHALIAKSLHSNNFLPYDTILLVLSGKVTLSIMAHFLQCLKQQPTTFSRLSLLTNCSLWATLWHSCTLSYQAGLDSSIQSLPHLVWPPRRSTVYWFWPAHCSYPV